MTTIAGEPEYLTPRTIAARYSCTVACVRSWIQHGVVIGGHQVRLAALRVGRSWRVRAEDWETFLRQCNPDREQQAQRPVRPASSRLHNGLRSRNCVSGVVWEGRVDWVAWQVWPWCIRCGVPRAGNTTWCRACHALVVRELHKREALPVGCPAEVDLACERVIEGEKPIYPRLGFSSSNQPVPEDASPSWDNAVRVLEDSLNKED